MRFINVTLRDGVSGYEEILLNPSQITHVEKSRSRGSFINMIGGEGYSVEETIEEIKTLING